MLICKKPDTSNNCCSKPCPRFVNSIDVELEFGDGPVSMSIPVNDTLGDGCNAVYGIGQIGWYKAAEGIGAAVAGYPNPDHDYVYADNSLELTFTFTQKQSRLRVQNNSGCPDTITYSNNGRTQVFRWEHYPNTSRQLNANWFSLTTPTGNRTLTVTGDAANLDNPDFEADLEAALNAQLAPVGGSVSVLLGVRPLPASLNMLVFDKTWAASATTIAEGVLAGGTALPLDLLPFSCRMRVYLTGLSCNIQASQSTLDLTYHYKVVKDYDFDSAFSGGPVTNYEFSTEDMFSRTVSSSQSFVCCDSNSLSLAVTTWFDDTQADTSDSPLAIHYQDNKHFSYAPSIGVPSITYTQSWSLYMTSDSPGSAGPWYPEYRTLASPNYQRPYLLLGPTTTLPVSTPRRPLVVSGSGSVFPRALVTLDITAGPTGRCLVTCRDLPKCSSDDPFTLGEINITLGAGKSLNLVFGENWEDTGAIQSSLGSIDFPLNASEGGPAACTQLENSMTWQTESAPCYILDPAIRDAPGYVPPTNPPTSATVGSVTILPGGFDVTVDVNCFGQPAVYSATATSVSISVLGAEVYGLPFIGDAVPFVTLGPPTITTQSSVGVRVDFVAQVSIPAAVLATLGPAFYANSARIIYTVAYEFASGEVYTSQFVVYIGQPSSAYRLVKASRAYVSVRGPGGTAASRTEIGSYQPISGSQAFERNGYVFSTDGSLTPIPTTQTATIALSGRRRYVYHESLRAVSLVLYLVPGLDEQPYAIVADDVRIQWHSSLHTEYQVEAVTHVQPLVSPQPVGGLISFTYSASPPVPLLAGNAWFTYFDSPYYARLASDPDRIATRENLDTRFSSGGVIAEPGLPAIPALAAADLNKEIYRAVTNLGFYYGYGNTNIPLSRVFSSTFKAASATWLGDFCGAYDIPRTLPLSLVPVFAVPDGTGLDMPALAWSFGQLRAYYSSVSGDGWLFEASWVYTGSGDTASPSVDLSSLVYAYNGVPYVDVTPTITLQPLP